MQIRDFKFRNSILVLVPISVPICRFLGTRDWNLPPPKNWKSNQVFYSKYSPGAGAGEVGGFQGLRDVASCISRRAKTSNGSFIAIESGGERGEQGKGNQLAFDEGRGRGWYGVEYLGRKKIKLPTSRRS